MLEGLRLKDLDIKLKSKNHVEYLDIECAFDIETTSITLENGQDVGFMYAWSLGFKNKNHLVIGRTWQEFRQLLDDLTAYYHLGKDRKLVIYVHNLGYEFQFMRKYFKWANVFTVDEREPIIAETTGGIEFRDSYILSGYSLDDTAKMLVNHDIKKLKGNLDYTKIRHSKTKLTDEEIDYMINDVLIILYYIHEQRKIYGDITKIPITNTRRVRDFVRHNCFFDNPKDPNKSSYGKRTRYKDLMKSLTLTNGAYIKSKQAFQGGYVHANANYIDKTLDDVVSYDITSSYPSAMVTEQFPMSKGERVRFTKEKNLDYWLKDHVLIFDVHINNLIRKQNVFEDYLSESKCIIEQGLINNGRVQGAKNLITTITSVDLKIINQVYDYDDIKYSNVYAFRKGYLPSAILTSIITLFNDKTTLRDIEGKELEAQLSKELLNSTYGMMVTDVVKNKVEYNNDLNNWVKINKNPTQEINNYNNQDQRFLYYPWGVFVSAYARLNLWYAILALGEDYVYSDTDSVKFLNHEKHKPFFNQYNKMIDIKLKKVANYYRGINYDDFNPVSKVTGESKTLGHFVLDGYYNKFKTLGAKLYIASDYEDDIEITVSGLNKNQGREYLIMRTLQTKEDPFDVFSPNLTIPKDFSGKMTHKYIDSKHIFDVKDYQGNKAKVVSKSSIYMEKSPFTIDSVKLAKQQLEDMIKGIRPIGNHLIN